MNRMISWKSRLINFSVLPREWKCGLKEHILLNVRDLRRMRSTGAIEEVYCTYDPATRSGESTSEKKVKGTLHWVSAQHAVDAEVRLYDRLFNHEDPAGQKDDDYRKFLNPDSLKILQVVKLNLPLDRQNLLISFSSRDWGIFVLIMIRPHRNLFLTELFR